MNHEQRTAEELNARRTERWVGVFITVAVVLLITGFGYYLYHNAQRKGWLVPRCPFFTLLQSGTGLNTGDPVTMMGFNVGEITTITAEPPGSYAKVFVAFEIRQPYYGYIWADSKVRIATAGLLGGRRLELIPGSTGAPLVYETGGRPSELLVGTNRVAFAKQPKGVYLLTEEEAALSDRAEQLLTEINAALPGVFALTNRLNVVLDNTSVLLTNSAALVVNLNQTAAQLAPVISNAAVITGNLRDPRGSFGEWALPVDLHTNLNASIITLTTGLNDTLLNLAAITGNLNSQVQSNDQMLAGISKLVVDTDNLVQGLKKHWLLRGVFPASKPGTTNAPPKTSP